MIPCGPVGTGATSLQSSLSLRVLPQQEGFAFQLNILWVKHHWVFFGVLHFKCVYLFWLKLA